MVDVREEKGGQDKREEGSGSCVEAGGHSSLLQGVSNNVC